jgi:UPF0755 protein
MAKKQHKKLSKINKVLLIILSVIIVFLITFVIASKIYLAPVDKNNNSYVEFTVENGWGKNKIADELQKSGLIKNALFFKFYIKLNINKELYAGTYRISKSMNVDEIIALLNSNNSLENESVTITFIEGKRFTDYAKNISTTFNIPYDDVIAKGKDPEFLNKLIKNYWFVTDDILNTKIYYPLEGYIFPDTYNFKKTATAEEILDKMIKTMQDKLDIYKDEIKVSSLNIHELLTLASIVELEGANSNDRAGVAGVFYNRIKANMSLGSDATTYYAVNKTFKDDLTGNNLKSCNGYNTRAESTCPIIGLPVGPIDSPSLASITATIEPEQTTAYYFVADKNKKTYFSDTYDEHVKTVSKLKQDGLWFNY